MANQEHLNTLIKRFTDGTISKEDYIELMAHLNSAKDTDEVFLAMDKVWAPESIEKAHSPEEMDALYDKLISDKGFKKTSKVKLWPKIAIAASVTIAISAGLWFYVAHQRMINIQSQTTNKNDISPGRNTATLTLSNGKHINLSDAKKGLVIEAAKLSYNDGTEIKESKPTSLLTITTPNGGMYQVRLSDGTKVWLNATSILKFPSNFTKSKYRKVELTGEAYFEVEKDKTMPFIVASRGQEVEVLGTHFNVNSYADEGSIRTTLLEGAVKVTNLKSKASNFLRPNQQAILTGANQIEVRDLDAEASISWKKGEFTFDREEISSIMRKVARWYNVQIVYKDNLNGVKLTGSVSRFENISKLLKVLENTQEVNFKIDGNKVIVTR
ncbi:FecR family protein [Pedobacter nyackensis]|uniref:FecR family protein n=1 Tax=Pedobacter nyackensis TaxID=475255 RepID=A0A1W2A9D0_9SPHI|nr:FecR domain-containing protein [Pedobacter nyackensis]SMC57349.1 FecR family protein [Pedobacter nyackensis]